MKEIYQSDLKKRMHHFWSVYIFLILPPVFIFYIRKNYSYDIIIIDVIGIIIFFLIFFIPTYFIHQQYHKKSKNCSIEIDNVYQQIEFHDNKEKIQFYYSDINYIEIYKTRELIQNIIHLTPWSTYNYARISINKRKVIIVTCFLVDQLDKHIKIDKNKIILRPVAFPNIKKINNYT